MADAKVLEFIKKVEADPNLAEQVRSVSVDDKAKSFAELALIAAGAGYALSPAALEQGLQETAPRELSDGELDAVSGGLVDPGDKSFTVKLSPFGGFYSQFSYPNL